MKDYKISVIGGDMRQKYLISDLAEKGYNVYTYGVNDEEIPSCKTLTDALYGAYAVILPFPLSPDGVYLNAICEDCNVRLSSLFEEISAQGITHVLGGGIKSSTHDLAGQYGITLFDYGTNEDVLIKNALCTAEGAIEIAMRELPINLHGCNSVVVGYGRIGRLLANRLKPLGCTTCVIARRSETLTAAECDGMKTCALNEIERAVTDACVIYNTVPSMVFNKELLPKLKKDCLIIDLASAPGGVDFNEAKKLGLKVIWALSLPGKCSPKSAALIIGNAVENYLNNTY